MTGASRLEVIFNEKWMWDHVAINLDEVIAGRCCYCFIEDSASLKSFVGLPHMCYRDRQFVLQLVDQVACGVGRAVIGYYYFSG
jgi:hypothetical protein